MDSFWELEERKQTDKQECTSAVSATAIQRSRRISGYFTFTSGYIISTRLQIRTGFKEVRGGCN
jgi:hypothetical protein